MQRIAQNLIMNALKATERGGVQVQWSSAASQGPGRWKLCIQDTGPGMELHSNHPLRSALKEATQKAHEIEHDNSTPTMLEHEAASASVTQPNSPSIWAGEGIGLSIVKRLCDLLGASIELETAPGHGTTVQIVFPLSYGLRDNGRK
jgi:signal transduction histidine kinase